jgi:hypothetical protein
MAHKEKKTFYMHDLENRLLEVQKLLVTRADVFISSESDVIDLALRYLLFALETGSGEDMMLLEIYYKDILEDNKKPKL